MLDRRGLRLTRPILALSLLFAVACTHATVPPASTTPRADVLPLVDHHQHLLSEAAGGLVNRVLPRVELPDDLARLLSARVTAWNDAAALRELYAEDAVVLGPESPGWIRGRDAATKMLSSVFARPYDMLPTTFGVTASGAFIAGHFARPNESSGKPIGYFILDLQKRPVDGRWEVVAETPIFPGPAHEPTVTADDLIAMLDIAGIRRAVVLSNAYYFDAPEIATPSNVVALVRAENDWTAEQAERHPGRLVAVCSVNPLAAYAIEEIDRCGKSGRFKGLKLHFDTSGVDLTKPADVEKVRAVAAAANRNALPLIIHAQSRGADPRAAARALLDIIQAAPDVSTQIAHLWGGGAFSEGALTAYAETIEEKHPGAKRLLFDVAQMWNSSDKDLERAAALMRRIGLKRILYASDGPQFGGSPPAEAWSRFRARVPLTEAEFRVISENVAPYF